MSVSTVPTSAPSLDDIELAYKEAIAAPPAQGMTPEEVIAFRKTDKGKSLQGWIKNKFTACKDARQKEERQWNANLAMYNGNQWAEFYANGPNYGYLGVPRSVGSNRERQTINRIKPIVRTEMAKFMSQKPGATVVPSTDEDDDILAAEAGEQAWNSVQTRCHLDDYWRDAVFWMGITGNGFIKTIWNPDLTDTDSDLDGDVDYKSVSPYKIFVADLAYKDLQEQPFMFHAYARSTEQLSLLYKDVLEGELAPSCKEVSIQEAAYAAPKSQQDPKTYDSNMLYEFWVKPGNCKYLPDGGVITLIDDLIVGVIETMPYDHGDYPFAHLGHIETERFYRTSIIEDLIDLQKDYNKLRSQIAESRKKMAKPQLLSPKGAIVASKVTTEIGQIIEYKLGMQAPTPMPLMNLPPYVLQEVEFIKADFEDISGQHEVSKGQAPTGVTAATAIAYLQESDDSYLLPSFKNVEATWGRIAKQTLMLLVQYWDVKHIVKIVGKEDAFSTQLLTGAELKRATDVRIEPGSSLPQSKAARQAFIMDLMANGYVPPEEGLDMMEIGGTKKLLDQLKNDKRQAQRENIKFKRMVDADIQAYEAEFEMALQQGGISPEELDPETGMPLKAPLMIPVHDFDNHEIHIEEHNRFRKSQAWETLSPQVQTLMQSHVKMHEVMAQQKMLEQTLSQIPTDGTTPGVSGMIDDNGQADFSESGGMAPPEDPNAAPGAPSDAEPLPMEA